MDELDALVKEIEVGKMNVGKRGVVTQLRPQQAPVRQPLIQSQIFRVCPNCGSNDVTTNSQRAFSYCEKCHYAVDPTNRPSQKQIQQMQSIQAGQPYQGTNALLQLQQTSIRHNEAMLRQESTGHTAAKYDLFHACQTNDIKKINYYLDMGIDINCSDFDTGSTPLHWAAAKSQQHAIRLLVERGALVNAQNKRGVTPLHSLILNRIEPLAFWLIRKGADVTITDNEGHTPLDLALPWTQTEMKEIFAEVQAGRNLRQIADPQTRVVKAETRSSEPAQVRPEDKPLEREVMKIYLKNDAYKSLVVTSRTTAKELVDQMAEKLNLGGDFARFFDVTERVKRGDQYFERRVDTNANIFELRSKWPLIFGESGNETHLHCRFIVDVKRGTSIELQEKFRQAIFGGQAKG